MIAPRAVCLLVGLTAALGALLCFSPGTLSAAHVLTTLACASVAMLATAVGALLVADWHADVQSRYDWAQLGLTPAHLSAAAELPSASNFDPHYLAAESDEALRYAFPSYRAVAQIAHDVSIPAPSAEPTSPQYLQDQERNVEALSDGHASERASRPVVAAFGRGARTVARSRIDRCHAKEITPRSRLVANGNAWPDWRAPTSPQADKTADVVVLSNHQHERAQPPPVASVVSNGAESTAQPACRGPPRSSVRRSGVPADPVVRDNLGQKIPIGRAELDVIESYLDQELRELLGAGPSVGGKKA